MILIMYRRLVSCRLCLVLNCSVRYVLPCHSFFCSFTDPTLPSPIHPQSSHEEDPFILKYLIQTFGVSESRARSSLARIPRLQTSEKPDSVVRLFQQHRFSFSDIQKAVQIAPLILFLDAQRNLEPKLQFFQEIGFTGPELGFFISKNPTLLTHSLERRLAPSVEVLRRFLSNQDLVRVLRRCKWIIKEDPNLKLLPNITFLRDCCGIDRSQLSMLLVRQPSLFVLKESKLQGLVQKVREMGFTTDSQMFVYALYTITCMTPKTIERKFELFRSYGFSDKELMQLFKGSPSVFRTSEEKLKLGLEFFLMEVGANRSELISYAASLMYSMDKRVFPRYRVLQILDSKGLLKKGMRLVVVIQMTEELFLKRYVLRFKNEATELLSAYKQDILGAS